MDLQRISLELALEITPKQSAQIENFVSLLAQWNKRINLIASIDEVYSKHIYDSLALIKVIDGFIDRLTTANRGLRVLDIGSGAGFPGLIMAIMRQHWQIQTADRRGKKITFQNHVRLTQGLDNLKPHKISYEELEQTYNVLVTRASINLASLLADAPRLLDDKGCVLAVKGSQLAHDTVDKSVLTNFSEPIVNNFENCQRSMVVISYFWL